MMERYKTICQNWNEDTMPETETRKLKIIEALPRLYKYIKEEFILTNSGIDERTDTFLQEYTLITKDKTSPQKIGRMLKEINIKTVKLSNNAGYKYNISKEDLLKVFTDKKWIDETIDLINDDKLRNNNKALDGESDENLKLIETLKLQLEEAQNKIKELESKKIKKIKKVVAITEK